ncbi:hypothetical protein ACPXCE_24620 [Streptomyces sp. DT24]|uniref:hypothetical protein n=1 Tax=unclassified Streptomyces TaxID=2593676 RepID=UPI0023B9036D|nr:hypothetical protein [Streptomyces sp. AM 4-1-1]WEH32361.1 hypothetical protein PZB75_02555 [Streptomyces sp. AM 4-1-1]
MFRYAFLAARSAVAGPAKAAVTHSTAIAAVMALTVVAAAPAAAAALIGGARS